MLRIAQALLAKFIRRRLLGFLRHLNLRELRWGPLGRQPAQTLLESLDLGADFEVSEAWRNEIRRRCAEIDGGAVTPIPGDQAVAGLRAKYGQ